MGEKFLAMESLVSLRSAAERSVKNFPEWVLSAIRAREAVSPKPEGEGTPSQRHWFARDVPGCERAVVFHTYHPLCMVVPAFDAVATMEWIVTDTFAIQDGEVVRRVVDAYDRCVPARGYAGDVCVYCGADNGPHGEDRDGLYCGCCGGN